MGGRRRLDLAPRELEHDSGGAAIGSCLRIEERPDTSVTRVNAESSPRGPRWLDRLCMALGLGSVLLFVGLVFAGHRHDFDDAYMFVRYADHLLAGLGHAWNPDGEQTFGSTSLLHVAVVTVLRAVVPASDRIVLQTSSAAAALAAVAAARLAAKPVQSFAIVATSSPPATPATIATGSARNAPRPRPAISTTHHGSSPHAAQSENRPRIPSAFQGITNSGYSMRGYAVQSRKSAATAPSTATRSCGPREYR